MNAPISTAPTAPVSEQARAARSGVLAVVELGLGAMRVTGKDRVTWLNGLVTCDLVKRAPGEARYGLVVVRSGKVLADVTLVLEEEDAYVVTPAALLGALREHLDHYLVMEDAEMTTPALEVISLHGPQSAAVLAAAREAGAAGGAIDRTGLGGAVVVFATADEARAGAIRSAMTSSLAAVGGVWGDEAGWDALRLERNVPRFGVDFDDKMYPQEAALEKAAVSFDKGCYLGQEVVCMLEMRGHVKRKLVALVVEGEGLPERGAPVTDAGGAAIGELTSVADSPTLSRVVALAVLKRAHTEPGTRVVVAGRSAEVVQRPA